MNNNLTEKILGKLKGEKFKSNLIIIAGFLSIFLPGQYALLSPIVLYFGFKIRNQVFLKKFNKKYQKSLTETQKEILREYIKCSSDRKFDKFIEKQTKQIENTLYNSMKTIKDQSLVSKICEVMMKLTNISIAKKDRKTEMLMTYSQLIDELKQLEKNR